MNDNVYDQASVGTEELVDVEAIDRVEVIRGPSTSLYGTEAFFAVINVITKSGGDLNGKEITAAGGSYSTGQGRAAYGSRLDSGVEIYLSGAYYDSGGQNLFYREFDSPANNNGWARHADGDSFERNYRVEAGYSNRDKQIPTASFGTLFNDSRARTIDERAFLDLHYERGLTHSSRLVASASYDGYWYRGDYPYSAGGLSKDYGYGRWWTGEVRSVTTLRGGHKVIGGAEIRYNDQQTQGYYDTNPYFLYLKDTRQSSIWALYLQEEFHARDSLIVNVGVRHDNYDTFGGTTNPRLGVIYSIRDATTLKFLFGRAFRAPNVYELYYDDGGVSQKANPNLRPETIRTYEIALEHGFGDRLRGVASVYHYGITDLITIGTDPADGLDVFENVSRVKSNGIELELEGALARHLEGRVSYALQRSEDISGAQELTNSPRHLAKANLTAPLLSDRLLLSAEAQYMSRRLTLSGEPTGGFTVANVNLLTRSWRKGPSVSLGVFNLFDRRYGDPGSAEHLQEVIPQDGRNYRVQVRYEF
ncbi:MAG: hypothetical protein AUH92_06275 [Acidobacteria bacterium 13_1_40CM_4_69_4]|nr:MAG: hypothetical protein AUH92_06275 [Acidobacteria bacterium 13_1_40CM_4_69_4]